jgi:hypothetical protein
LREDRAAAFDVPDPWQCHPVASAMQSPPSVYVSELSRRGLARRRARIRRRAVMRRLPLLAVSSGALAIAVLERVTTG